jgi:eight-cysteine-cluster-containing protein
MTQPMWRSSTLFLTVAVAAVAAMAACSKPGPAQPPPDHETPPAAECRATGCSGTVCSAEDVVTTCEFRPEYACYQDATCAAQSDGQCGWTMTPELEACLADPPDEAAADGAEAPAPVEDAPQ